MHLITRKRVVAFMDKHPATRPALTAWVRTVRAAGWSNIDELRLAYSHADPVTVGSGRIVTIFNICGNNYRLVAAIHYNRGKVFVLALLTHAEYSKNRWKERL